MDDCAGKTCSGVGQCQDGVNDYKCQCHPGYTGKDCQTSEQFPKIIFIFVPSIDSTKNFIQIGQLLLSFSPYKLF